MYKRAKLMWLQMHLGKQAELEALCSTTGRGSVGLAVFNNSCLDRLGPGIRSVVGGQFGEDNIIERNATHQQFDLRSRVLWNVLDLWVSMPIPSSSKQIGVKGVAGILKVNKDALGRYYRNSTSKGAALGSSHVVNIELAIITYLGTDVAPEATVESDAKGATSVAPLYFKSENGGGAISIHALGEQMTGWKPLGVQRRDEPIVLRRGLRGRKLFRERSGDKLSGRIFEWYVVADAAPDTYRPGHHKFVLHELIPDEVTQILSRSKHKWTGSTPQQMWGAMYKDPKGADNPNGTNNGIRLCGFDAPGVLQLIEAAEACDSEAAGDSLDSSHAHREFGSRRALDALSASSLRHMIYSASSAFKAAMMSVCPSDPRAAYLALRSSASFLHEWESDCEEQSIAKLAETPWVAGMVHAYGRAESRESRVAILSLFAPYFKVNVTESLFSVDHNEVHTAKVHSAQGDAGRQLERLKHQRFRWDAPKFSFLYQWARSDFGSTDSDASCDEKQRVDIRSRLYKQYEKHARQSMPDRKPCSADAFNKMMGDGFCDQTSESCCCGQCIEGG